jgi:hypothetical protein
MPLSTIPQAAAIPEQVPSGPQLITRTLLTQRLQGLTPKVTSWSFRRAEQQGLIRPDKTGRFAGHAVHYYDPARIPELVRQLLPPDSWTASTLVIHSECGPGRILTADPADPSSRVVNFFAKPAPATVPIAELRRLLSGTAMAQRVGVNRKSFLKEAAHRGIDPDYADSRRLFYDEGRIQDIRKRWSSPAPGSIARAGWLVLDARDDVARVEYVHSSGYIGLRTVADGRLTPTSDISSLRRLVSTRELARMEGVSRYKVNRLLAAAGVRSVHRGGKTVYWELDRALEAVRKRIVREHSATSLRHVARRCAVSPELLARRVRQDCIRTTGSANHSMDESEVERIERLDQARRTGWQRLCETGICQLQPRGRHGREVVGWDVWRLIEIAQTLSSPHREAFFDEVGWACDGAGQRRFQESLETELWRWRTTPEEHFQRAAQLLLRLFSHLPKTLGTCQGYVALIASGAPQRYGLSDSSLRLLANEAGCRTEIARQRFIGQIDRRVAELLTCEGSAPFLAGPGRPQVIRGVAYPEDEFVPGAVTLTSNDKQPHVGMIVRVEQRSWNALKRRWDKRIVVRVGSREVLLNPDPSATAILNSTREPRVRILLLVSDALALSRTMRDLTGTTRNRDTRELLLSRAS